MDEHRAEDEQTEPAFAGEPDEVLLRVAERARERGDEKIADAIERFVAERRQRN